MESHDGNKHLESLGAGMPTVEADDQACAVAKFVAQIIQSSIEIIKQEHDLIEFLDEALKDIADDTDEEDYNPTKAFSDNMTTVAPMPIPICQLNGEPIPDYDGDFPVTATQSVQEENTKMDTSMDTAVPDLSLVHVDGKKEDISTYIQSIIKEAQEKVQRTTEDFEEAPLATAESSMQEDVTLTGSYYTDDSPSKESRNVTDSEHKEDKENNDLSDSVTEVPASEVPVVETTVNNNQKTNGNSDEILEVDDVPFNQQSFIEVNSKDRNPKGKRKGRLSRLRESFRNMFSCTSSPSDKS